MLQHRTPCRPKQTASLHFHSQLKRNCATLGKHPSSGSLTIPLAPERTHLAQLARANSPVASTSPQPFVLLQLKKLCCRRVSPHRYASKCPLTSSQPRGEEKTHVQPILPSVIRDTHTQRAHTLPRPRKLISSGSPAPLTATEWWQTGRQRQFSRRAQLPAVGVLICTDGSAEIRF